jgi:hypothetical protein
MKRIIETKDLANLGKDYVDCVMQFDTGNTMNVTMTRNEYEAQKTKEDIYDNLMELEVGKVSIKYIMRNVDKIEHLANQRGYNNGYEDGQQNP